MTNLKERFHAIDKECSAALAVLFALLINNANDIMQAVADHLPDLLPYLSAGAVRIVGVAAFALKVGLAARKAAQAKGQANG